MIFNLFILEKTLNIKIEEKKGHCSLDQWFTPYMSLNIRQLKRCIWKKNNLESDNKACLLIISSDQWEIMRSTVVPKTVQLMLEGGSPYPRLRPCLKETHN
jgi:hypothetical protein